MFLSLWSALPFLLICLLTLSLYCIPLNPLLLCVPDPRRLCWIVWRGLSIYGAADYKTCDSDGQSLGEELPEEWNMAEEWTGPRGNQTH